MKWQLYGGGGSTTQHRSIAASQHRNIATVVVWYPTQHIESSPLRAWTTVELHGVKSNNATVRPHRMRTQQCVVINHESNKQQWRPDGSGSNRWWWALLTYGVNVVEDMGSRKKVLAFYIWFPWNAGTWNARDMNSSKREVPLWINRLFSHPYRPLEHGGIICVPPTFLEKLNADTTSKMMVRPTRWQKHVQTKGR